MRAHRLRHTLMRFRCILPVELDAHPLSNMPNAPPEVGSRVVIRGGYDLQPHWLNGADRFSGTIERFIPGQNAEPAMLVRLDSPLSVDGTTGDVLVLELRFVGQRWDTKGIVHLELCDFDPEPKAWQDRRQGRWIESHATYELVRELE